MEFQYDELELESQQSKEKSVNAESYSYNEIDKLPRVDAVVIEEFDEPKPVEGWQYDELALEEFPIWHQNPPIKPPRSSNKVYFNEDFDSAQDSNRGCFQPTSIPPPLLQGIHFQKSI